MSDAANIVHAFTAEQAVCLTGLTLRQLAAWERAGFFAPRAAGDDARSPHARLYAFEDVVGLRTIGLLQGQHGVSTPHLKEVARALAGRSGTPWSDITLRVGNGRVRFDGPEAGETAAVLDGPYVLLPIAEVVEEVRARAEAMRARDPATVGRIARHRDVAHNAPVIAGTRVRVSAVQRYLDAGHTPAEIVQEFPVLTEADVEAVRALAETQSAA